MPTAAPAIRSKARPRSKGIAAQRASADAARTSADGAADGAAETPAAGSPDARLIASPSPSVMVADSAVAPATCRVCVRPLDWRDALYVPEAGAFAGMCKRCAAKFARARLRGAYIQVTPPTAASAPATQPAPRPRTAIQVPQHLAPYVRMGHLPRGS